MKPTPKKASATKKKSSAKKHGGRTKYLRSKGGGRGRVVNTGGSGGRGRAFPREPPRKFSHLMGKMLCPSFKQ
jgi:hypothetical protein